MFLYYIFAFISYSENLRLEQKKTNYKLQILHYSKANGNTSTARKLDVSKSCVGLWRKEEERTLEVEDTCRYMQILKVIYIP